MSFLHNANQIKTMMETNEIPENFEINESRLLEVQKRIYEILALKLLEVEKENIDLKKNFNEVENLLKIECDEKLNLLYEKAILVEEITLLKKKSYDNKKEIEILKNEKIDIENEFNENLKKINELQKKILKLENSNNLVFKDYKLIKENEFTLFNFENESELDISSKLEQWIPVPDNNLNLNSVNSEVMFNYEIHLITTPNKLFGNTEVTELVNENLKEIAVQQYLDQFNKNSTVQDLKTIMKFNPNPHIDFYTHLQNNAILYACWRNCKLDIIKFFVDSGIDYKKRNSNLSTALHYSSRYNSEDFIDYFISLGLRIIDTEIDNWTPLHFACRYNKLSVVKTVFKYYKIATSCEKHDLNNLLTNDKSNILHLAVRNEILEVIEFVCELVDINLKDADGDTPLHIACKMNLKVDVIMLLISKGANIGILNNSYKTAYELGLKHNRSNEVMNFLKNKK